MTRRAVLGGVSVGEGLPVAVMGALNVSPESFYPGSVFTQLDALLDAAERMVEAGAAILDVGAMSTAPYLQTRISEEEEADRLGQAVERLAGKLGVPISADTSRALPAKTALEAGATILNDVSGLTQDPAIAQLVARAGSGLIVMASTRATQGGAGATTRSAGATKGGGTHNSKNEMRPAIAADLYGHPSHFTWRGSSPISIVTRLLGESLERARGAGVPEERIVVDPGIGFFRDSGRPWFEWDCAVLARLGDLRHLGRPLCVGVSRKSFIGALLGQSDPRERLVGSLAATAAAVLSGADLIRTHDVAETSQAVRVVQAIRNAREQT